MRVLLSDSAGELVYWVCEYKISLNNSKIQYTMHSANAKCTNLCEYPTRPNLELKFDQSEETVLTNSIICALVKLYIL